MIFTGKLSVARNSGGFHPVRIDPAVRRRVGEGGWDDPGGRRLGGAGLDVYEEEENVFFRDLSGQVLQDDQLALLTAFLTREALNNIMMTSFKNIADLETGRAC